MEIQIQNDLEEINLKANQENQRKIKEFQKTCSENISLEIFNFVSEMDNIRKQNLKQEIQEIVQQINFNVEKEDSDFLLLLKEFDQYLIGIPNLIRDTHLLTDLQKIRVSGLLDKIKICLENAVQEKNWIFKENEQIQNFINFIFEIVKKVRQELSQQIIKGFCSSSMKKQQSVLETKIQSLEQKIPFMELLFSLQSRIQLNKDKSNIKDVQIDSLDIQKEDLKEIVNTYLEQDFPQLIPVKEIVTKTEVKKEIQYVDRIEQKTVIQEQSNEFIQALELYKGIGTEQNFQKAKELFEAAILQGNTEALNYIGKMYKKGKGVPLSYIQALQKFQQGAELNNANCVYSLVKLIEKKNPQKLSSQDKKNAIYKFTKKAADLNYLEAIVDLGFFYDQGRITPQDNLLAKQYYLRAKERNHPRAMNNLASLILRMSSDFKDDQKEWEVFELYQKASDLQYPSAITNLGLCYLKGVGVQKNITKSLDLFQQASDLGDIEGTFYLAYFKLKEGYTIGGNQNYQQAFQLFQKILQEKPKHSESLYYMGHIYEMGLGVPVNELLAFQFYQKAFQSSKNPQGKFCFKLGYCFENKIGIKQQDIKQAFFYYDKGAKLNDLDCLTKIAEFMLQGVLIQQDFKGAIRILKDCAKQGNDLAKQSLQRLIQQGLVTSESKEDLSVQNKFQKKMNLNFNFEDQENERNNFEINKMERQELSHLTKFFFN